MNPAFNCLVGQENVSTTISPSPSCQFTLVTYLNNNTGALCAFAPGYPVCKDKETLSNKENAFQSSIILKLTWSLKLTSLDPEKLYLALLSLN